jgi:hypothetical protein
MKQITLTFGGILVLILVFFVYNYTKKVQTPVVPVIEVLSFNDCVKAGYTVMESYPRQCRTPDGRIYAEEIVLEAKYVNASSGMIFVNLPFPGAVTGKKFTVVGKARGMWYFEAGFPIEVLDKDAKSIATGIGRAQGDWTTTEFVPFSTEITIPDSYQGEATLILKNDNPSGLPENEASVSFPITIEY